MTALRQLNLFQKFLSQFPTFRSRNSSVNQGQFDVLKRIELRQEKELLKDKADLLVADLGQLFLSKTCNFFTFKVVLSTGWCIQHSDGIHQGRLTRTRWSHNGNKLTFMNF